jgi:hypothetical protein
VTVYRYVALTECILDLLALAYEHNSECFILIASDAYELSIAFVFLFTGKCQDKASPVTL